MQPIARPTPTPWAFIRKIKPKLFYLLLLLFEIQSCTFGKLVLGATRALTVYFYAGNVGHLQTD